MRKLLVFLQLSVITMAISVFVGTAGLSQAAALSLPQGASNFAASTSALKQDACKGLNQVDNRQGCGTGSKAFYRVIRTLVSLISYIVGIVAIVMIMVSGIKYMTSGGDAQKVGSAKNTLIYALIGLAVVALAQFLVQFVLTQANR